MPEAPLKGPWPELPSALPALDSMWYPNGKINGMSFPSIHTRTHARMHARMHGLQFGLLETVTDGDIVHGSPGSALCVYLLRYLFLHGGQCRFQKPATGRYDAYYLCLSSEGQHLSGNLNIIKEEKKANITLKVGYQNSVGNINAQKSSQLHFFYSV